MVVPPRRKKGVGAQCAAALKITVRRKFLASQVGKQEVKMQRIAEVLFSRPFH